MPGGPPGRCHHQSGEWTPPCAKTRSLQPPAQLIIGPLSRWAAWEPRACWARDPPWGEGGCPSLPCQVTCVTREVPSSGSWGVPGSSQASVSPPGRASCHTVSKEPGVQHRGRSACGQLGHRDHGKPSSSGLLCPSLPPGRAGRLPVLSCGPVDHPALFCRVSSAWQGR